MEQHHDPAAGGGTAPRGVEEVVGTYLRQRSCPVGLDNHLRNAGGAVIIEVLIEGGLQGLQRSAVARDRTNQVR